MVKSLSLILVHDPRYEALADFEHLRQLVQERAPEIEVFIAFNAIPSSSTRKKAARRPTLTFSPGRLKAFAPARGRTYAGRAIPKPEQCKLLEQAGLPIPKWALLTPETDFADRDWGEHVIVKPIARGTGSTGAGIQLMRTARARYRPPHDYPPNHPGRRGPMLVQKFVNTGRQPSHYRVCSLFGVPLYCVRFWTLTERADLSAGDEELEATIVATNTLGRQRKRLLVDEPDVLDLAKRAHAVAPDVPLMGIDILRDEGTGALYLLELNSGGKVWHISSRAGLPLRLYLGEQAGANSTVAEAVGRRILDEQFGFFDRAARSLIERTRAEAE